MGSDTIFNLLFIVFVPITIVENVQAFTRVRRHGSMRLGKARNLRNWILTIPGQSVGKLVFLSRRGAKDGTV